MSKLDWTIVRTAATGGLIIIIPGALASALLVDDAASVGWVLPFLAVILVGFGVAGYIAGRLRPDTPMLHGAVAALLTYIVAQVFGIVANLASGQQISWVTMVLTALLAGTFGISGAIFSDWFHRRLAKTT